MSVTNHEDRSSAGLIGALLLNGNSTSILQHPYLDVWCLSDRS